MPWCAPPHARPAADMAGSSSADRWAARHALPAGCENEHTVFVYRAHLLLGGGGGFLLRVTGSRRGRRVQISE